MDPVLVGTLGGAGAGFMSKVLFDWIKNARNGASGHCRDHGRVCSDLEHAEEDLNAGRKRFDALARDISQLKTAVAFLVGKAGGSADHIFKVEG